MNVNLPANFSQLLEPWHRCNTDLVKQLLREIRDDHVLARMTLKTIARRQDNDDVIFEIFNNEYKYAVVHLTWSNKTLNSNIYPSTQLYKSWQDLYKNRIIQDHKNFGD